ncbi:MAG: glucose-6-phosphate isomerase, partial [Rhodanobacteraceae bacterium]
MSTPSLRSSAEWQALAKHWRTLRGTTLKQLFEADPQRGNRLVAEGAGLHLDYSKNLASDETLRLLQKLAKARGVFARRDAMFRGDKINETEKRAVLHVALRAPHGDVIRVDGKDVVPEVHAVLD